MKDKVGNYVFGKDNTDFMQSGDGGLDLGNEFQHIVWIELNMKYRVEDSSTVGGLRGSKVVGNRFPDFLRALFVLMSDHVSVYGCLELGG